ncbi:hypothetical protein SAMN05421807_105171 [Virgibacillus chiguensis]|uniref:Uncharacterized protein n=1 Tax=Virgibacillus chiguensis TaxID=411959 RepID=A0A1M5RI49_9BACI|nr:hypothetical protein SAMN05421807_105171 [Virgibacillus chiguensis]
MKKYKKTTKDLALSQVFRGLGNYKILQLRINLLSYLATSGSSAQQLGDFTNRPTISHHRFRATPSHHDS